jgi:DNA polymerase-4
MRAKGLCGRTVTLKVRFANFKTITRSRTSDEPMDTAAELYAIAKDLYERLDPDRPRIRLLGVTVSGLIEGPAERQLDLLSGDGPRWPEATKAIDAIRTRFGDDALGPATLLDRSP